MPTLRLSDNDKSIISTEFDIVIGKARNNHPFPLNEEEIQELFIDTFPPTVASAYRELRNYDTSLLRISKYCSYFGVQDGLGGVYKITLYRAGVSHLPDIEPTVTGTQYPELLKWAKEYRDTDLKVTTAQRYVSRAINTCTSGGQILRVLPEDCAKFLPPRVTNTFAHAERRSRIPRDFSPVPEKAELVLNMLALGSISPNSKGINAEVSNYLDENL